MAALPRVFATSSLPGTGLDRLARVAALEVWRGSASPGHEALLAGVANADGLLCVLTDRVDAELLAAAPRLRAISSVSVGLDHIDLTAASARGIPVGHTPGVLTDTTAELAFALLLAASRRVVEADRFVRSGGWQEWKPDLLLGRDLAGSTLGIVGLGAIGRAVAKRAHAFGMKVLGWNRTPRDVAGVESQSLEALLRRSDFVSLHVALSAETAGLIGRRELGWMPRTAILVNTARGGIVDEAALALALREGRIAGAAFDVFAQEPLPAKSPLLEAPNLVLAPHIGSATLRTRERMADLAASNLEAALAGRPMPHCANPEVEAGRGLSD
jgi:glyoxylate reductase